MGGFIVKKLAWLTLVMLGVAAVTFLLGRLAPGDPVETLLSSVPNPSVQDRLAAREAIGLDLPLPAQFARWLGGILRGDLGVSYRTGRPVTLELAARLPSTIRLTLGAASVMLLFGFPVGIASALWPNRAADHLLRIVNVAAISVPSFCLGILLILVFGVRLKLFPTIGNESFRHLILPAVAMGIGPGAALARLLRAQLTGVMAMEHVQAARVFGVGPMRLFCNHILKNALPPVFSQIGLMLGAMLGGSAIIETLFAWPGAGSLIVEAIAGRDYPVVQAYALMMAAVYTLINNLIDLSRLLLIPIEHAPEAGYEG